MSVRTYYWQAPQGRPGERRIRRRLGLPADHLFRVGNAGDIWARALLERRYQLPVRNVGDHAPRLLTVGSIAHRVLAGDIVAGIGIKSRELSPPTGVRARVVGVRGPLTLEAFSDAGYDTTDVQFVADPGLLIAHDAPAGEAVSGRRICIPHYRCRTAIARSLPAGIGFVDIDASPLEVATAITTAELVYASSLHGIIFAHALGRPCVPFHPGGSEDLTKYEDYFLSVGLAWRGGLDAFDSVFRRPTPTSPHDVTAVIRSIQLPDAEELADAGVIDDA